MSFASCVVGAWRPLRFEVQKGGEGFYVSQDCRARVEEGGGEFRVSALVGRGVRLSSLRTFLSFLWRRFIPRRFVWAFSPAAAAAAAGGVLILTLLLVLTVPLLLLLLLLLLLRWRLDLTRCWARQGELSGLERDGNRVPSGVRAHRGGPR